MSGDSLCTGEGGVQNHDSSSSTMFNNNGGEQNMEEFTQQLFENLITATRISNNLPTEEEYQFYASFKPFKHKMNDLGKRILNLTQNFLQHDENNTKAPVINDSDDVDEVTEKYDDVVDFVDSLFEKVVCVYIPLYSLLRSLAQGLRVYLVSGDKEDRGDREDDREG